MIQRIQSFYLLLTTLFSVLFLGGNCLKFTDNSGNQLAITLRGLVRYAGDSGSVQMQSLWPCTLLVFIIALVSFILIFLYKNRKLQIRLTTGLLILTILLIILVTAYSFYITVKYNADIVPGIKMILPLLMAVCIYLAYRGIKKDDSLIKSYDRLR
jgi:presenilin-like A22 family membrane protease